jgi:hypothetical protein
LKRGPSDGAIFLLLAGVNTSGSAPQLDVPHILFQVSGVQRQSAPFDVTADGKNSW